MKVNKFNTRDAANIPQTLRLKDPFTQQLIKEEDGSTLDIYVYGAKSDISRNALKNSQRKYGKTPTEDEAQRSGAEYLAALTQGWNKNIEDDNGPIPFSFENAVQLYMKQDWIAEQVGLFSRDIANYDPTRSGGLKFGSDNSPGSTQSQKTRTEKKEKGQEAESTN